MDIVQHIVSFDTWCANCKHAQLEETKDPCNECLDNPVNMNSYQPTLFEKKDS